MSTLQESCDNKQNCSYDYGCNLTGNQGCCRHKIIQGENSYDTLLFMPKEIKLMGERNGVVPRSVNKKVTSYV